MSYQQGPKFSNFEERRWPVAKYTDLSGSQRALAGGNLRACLSHHRRQLAVWQDDLITNVTLHHSNSSARTRGTAVVIKSDGFSFRLRFGHLADRISFCAAMSDMIPVSVEAEGSQETSSQGWQSSSQNGCTSASSDTGYMGSPITSSSNQRTPPPSQLNTYGMNQSQSIQESLTPPYQSWKMTPPSSQGSQPYKNNPLSLNPIERLQMEKNTWSTPVKRGSDTKDDSIVKKKKDNLYTPPLTHTWDSSIDVSGHSFESSDFDSQSINDSFSTTSSQLTIESSQSIIPHQSLDDHIVPSSQIQMISIETQTDDDPYPSQESLPTLIHKLMNHPDFISFVQSVSSCIDGNSDLQSLLESNFPLFEEKEKDKEGEEEEEDEDCDTTQPMDGEEFD